MENLSQKPLSQFEYLQNKNSAMVKSTRPVVLVLILKQVVKISTENNKYT